MLYVIPQMVSFKQHAYHSKQICFYESVIRTRDFSEQVNYSPCVDYLSNDLVNLKQCRCTFKSIVIIVYSRESSRLMSTPTLVTMLCV